VTIGPISFVVEQVTGLIDGTRTANRRPRSRLGKFAPGDQLWVREPFHLPVAFDRLSPLQFVANGSGEILWGTDAIGAAPRTLARFGRRRFAREMPRALHRFHVILQSVRTEQLHAIDDAGAQAEGFASRTAFIAAWDPLFKSGFSITGDLVAWADNPLVDVLTFKFVAAPLASTVTP